MDRLHLQRRPLTSLFLALVGLVSGALACADEVVEIPDELRGEPACAWVIDSLVHFADGGVRVLYDEQSGGTGAGCLCLSEQEFESGSRNQDLNDLALVVCNQLAAQHDFEWNDCQMDYESERWLDFVFWAVEEFEHPTADALGCVGE